jgi:hypothetical protein
MRNNYQTISSASAFVTIAVMLAACSSSVPSFGLQPSLARAASRSEMHSDKSPGALYISSAISGSAVVVYSGGTKYLRTIIDGIRTPQGIALDSHGQLVVANYAANTATVYTSTGKLLRTLSRKLIQPFLVAVTSTDAVYVTARNNVSIYANSRQREFKEIHLSAGGIAIDALDNVYLSNGNAIYVYAPGATEPSRKITKGLNDPGRLAIDSSGNLYADNLDSSPCGFVTVHDAATGALKYTIKKGVCEPVGLAFDAAGNLYVGNTGNGNDPAPSVTEYGAGSNTPTSTITNGVTQPLSLLFDPSGNLYVANAGYPGNVTVYAPNQTSPSRVLTKGIGSPFQLQWLP